MFTSRAEYRLSLRADNADQRLTDLGIALGCIGQERRTAHAAKSGALTAARQLAEQLSATPNELARYGLSVKHDGVRRSALELLSYTEIAFKDLLRMWPQLGAFPTNILEQIEIDGRYAGYLERQEQDIRAFNRDENLLLPENLDVDSIGGLSAEVRQKLKLAQPATLGAASRIPGVTPAAVIALLRHVKRRPDAA